MGSSYIYKCVSCDYHEITSGRFEYGIYAVIEPHICSDCKRITDVVIGQRGERMDKEDLPKNLQDLYGKCTHCGGEELTKWDTETYPCPKCGNEMRIDPDKPPIMWD